jgi:hypothetical protein
MATSSNEDKAEDKQRNIPDFVNDDRYMRS